MDSSAPAAGGAIPGRSYTQVTMPREDGTGPPPHRVIHDNPPVWDGKDPDNQIVPYLKLLGGWLATTKTLKTRQGMIILNYCQGDLKLLVDSLDLEELTAADSGQKIYEPIKNNYSECKSLGTRLA